MSKHSSHKLSTRSLPAYRRWVAVGHGLYAVIQALALWGIHGDGDRTWLGTILLFSPRWVLGLPLLLLISLALRFRRRWLWSDAVFAGLLIGPVMGLKISVPSHPAPAENAPAIRVVTCNLRGNRSHLHQLFEVGTEADLLTLQECPPDSFADVPEKLREGWHIQQDGRLCIASRYPLSDPKRLDRKPFEGWGTAALGCRVEWPHGAFHCVTLHLTTPREGLEAILYSGQKGIAPLKTNTELRSRESDWVSQWIAAEFGPCLVTGDFNMPVESQIYQRFWSQETNAYSKAGCGFGFTKFTRWHGVRIDHILLSDSWKVLEARVLSDVGSDHRPLEAVCVRRAI